MVSSRPDCIFEIHQLCQSGFSRVYSNYYCSSSFEPEIIKIGQSSHKMYSNNIVNFQESTTILNACTEKFCKLIECTTYKFFPNYLPIPEGKDIDSCLSQGHSYEMKHKQSSSRFELGSLSLFPKMIKHRAHLQK